MSNEALRFVHKCNNFLERPFNLNFQFNITSNLKLYFLYVPSTKEQRKLLQIKKYQTI